VISQERKVATISKQRSVDGDAAAVYSTAAAAADADAAADSVADADAVAAGGSDAPVFVGHNNIETNAAANADLTSIPLRPANMAKLILQREVSGTSYSITLCHL
jgi:hypothetical protein